MKLLTLAALAASLFGQDPTATVATVNVETLKQLGIVTTPYSVDHFQVIVRIYRPTTHAVEVSLSVSIDGKVTKYTQLAEVTRYGTNDGELGKRCGAVVEFPVPDIARAVVVGEPEVFELVKVAK